MGTTALTAITPFSDKLPYQTLIRPQKNGESLPAGRSHATQGSGLDPAALVEEAFQRMTYQRVAAAAKFQQAAVTGSEEGGESQTAQVQQMTFDFFSETRIEELTRFSQRAQAVGEGLEGAQQASYMEASQRVSMRFSASMSISGSALNGFANVSEAGQDQSDFMDRLIGFANQLLAAGDALFDEFLSMFDGSSMQDFQDRISALFQQMMEQLFGNSAFPMLSSNTSGASSQSSNIRFSVQMEFEFSFEFTVNQGEVQQSDPITFDLDGDGIELTHYAGGAQFDITGSGQTVRTAFVTGGDAFLALDRDGNGRITSGKELFGDQNGAANGYEELRKLDSNQDGVINRLDKDFSKLVLFRDNGNGIQEEGELIGLKEAGISEISLGYRNVHQAAKGGNSLAQMASFRWLDGRTGQTADAILNYLA